MIYTVLTSIYYPAAFLIDKLNDREGGKYSDLYNQLEGLFYWAHTHIIYIFSLMLSSLVGVLWFHRKSDADYVKGFGVVFITSLIAFLTLIIFSQM